jgi:two-component system, sensor histidine kinase and response regulator
MTNIKSFLKILCLEDAPKDAELLKEMLVDAGYEVEMDVAEDQTAFTSSLITGKYDIILADYTLPGFNASEALKLAITLQPRTPFICISGTIGEDKAVELVKQGATDYVLKDRLGRLIFTVNRALNDVKKREEWERVQDKLRDKEIIEMQNEELKILNATKDKFFSIIAHDLRNPFNSILGFSEILMKQVQDLEKEKIEHIARIIYQSSKMAVDLLMNLVEWSLSQSGRIEYKPGNVQITEIMNEVEPIVAPLASQKKIEILQEIPPQLTAFADKQLLGTVLRNLISNAIKFTHQGGKVIVSAREQNDNVVISVNDTGIGIPEEKIDRLFRIDESFSTEGTDKEMGTGLGLIICREFVEKHGGRIWAESHSSADNNPGGSTFSFSIPRNDGGRNQVL